jgi:hypothetical protein
MIAAAAATAVTAPCGRTVGPSCLALRRCVCYGGGGGGSRTRSQFCKKRKVNKKKEKKMYQASRCSVSRPCYCCCRRFGGGNLNGVGVGGCCYSCHGAVWSYCRSIVAGVATLRPCAMVVVVAIHLVSSV